jgi:O-antigen/teichoic acid export membrane protein
MKMNFPKISPATIHRSSFVRNVFSLMTGTTVAQAIPILISPVLTRLYKPEEFGAFALYMAIASIFSVVVSGRYELAVILPEDDEEAINVVALSIILSFIVSGTILIAILLLRKILPRMVGNEGAASWIYFIPLTILLTGIFNTFYYWSTRKLQYKRLVVSKVSQTASTGLVNIAMGLKKLGASGLILGYIIGQFVTTGFLCVQMWKGERKTVQFINRQNIVKQLYRYKKFPLFSIPADFINVMSNQLPIYILNLYFGGVIVGFYALTQRVLAAPISLISASILDVFRQRASSDYAKSGDCRSIFLKTLAGLTAISILPFVAFFFAAPTLFSWIFGENWLVAGEYARIMSVMFFFRFISSPLSFVIYIAEKQQYDLIWQFTLLISTAASMYAGVYYNDVKVSLICFSWAYSILYLVYLVISYRFSKVSP